MISAFAPLWTITFLGWAAARFAFFTPAVQHGLTSFAFHLAIPAVLFVTLARLPADRLPWTPLAAYAVTAILVGVAGFLLIRLERVDERVIAGMASAYVNSGNLGIPVAIHVLGDASLIVAVVAFQTVLATPIIVALLDGGGPGRFRRILTLPLRAPVVLASLAGTLFAVLRIPLPGLVSRPLDILAGAAVPAALFALGMSLHLPPGERLEWRRPSLGVVVGFKLVLMPVVAYLIARFLFGLDGLNLLAITLFAGLPTAQNTYIYATQHDVPSDLSRDAVLVTSVLSLGTLSAIVLLWS